MTEEPIVTQLKGMIKFLVDDLMGDQKMLDDPRYSWIMKFHIRRQMSTTRKQILHYKDKIKQYESDSFK